MLPINMTTVLKVGDFLYHEKLELRYEIIAIRKYSRTPDEDEFFQLQLITEEQPSTPSIRLSRRNLISMQYQKL